MKDSSLESEDSSLESEDSSREKCCFSSSRFAAKLLGVGGDDYTTVGKVRPSGEKTVFHCFFIVFHCISLYFSMYVSLIFTYFH